MPSFEPGRHRELLGFEGDVLESFQFLTTEFGFKVVRQNPTFVRYESQRAFANIYHGRGSYELGFEVGLLPSPGERENNFTLHEIILLQQAEAQTGYTFYQASTRERVKEWLPKLAQLVRDYAGPALNGDAGTFSALSELRKRNSDQFLLDMELSRARTNAENAWSHQDFQKFVSIMEPLESHLSPAERKKLSIAKRKAGGAG